MNTDKIREHMPVVDMNNKSFGSIDRMEGDYIKLTKDSSGQHHFFPSSWVKSVDDKVHLDRAADQAMREWKTAAPASS